MENLKLLLVCFGLFLGSPIYAQIADKAENVAPLLIGEQIPDATLLNAKGEKVQLDMLLSQKPTVLIFYRGGWCPFCSVHLAEIAKIEKDILQAGYQIIAISPDDYQNLQNTAETGKLAYQVFSDAKGELLQAIGIAFRSPDKVKEYIASKTKGKVSDIMPVPSLMIVDKKRTILFEYISPDYKKRISSKLLMAVLENINI